MTRMTRIFEWNADDADDADFFCFVFEMPSRTYSARSAVHLRNSAGNNSV